VLRARVSLDCKPLASVWPRELNQSLSCYIFIRIGTFQ
jgi:hypothetical protein